MILLTNLKIKTINILINNVAIHFGLTNVLLNLNVHN